MTLHVVIPTLERQEKLKVCLGSLDRQTFQDFQVFIVHDTLRKKAPRIWNEHLRDWPDAALVYLCDDIELFPDCFERAMAQIIAAGKDNDFLLGFKQEIEGATDLCPVAMGIIGTRFADRFPGRQVFCPDYSNMGVDAELYEYAVASKTLILPEDARLRHFHPAYYSGAMDKTHWITREHADRDTKTRAERKRRGLLWGRDHDLIS